MKKKLLSLVLALAVCLGLCGTAFAENSVGKTVTTPDGKFTITNVLDEGTTAELFTFEVPIYWVPDTGAMVTVHVKSPEDGIGFGATWMNDDGYGPGDGPYVDGFFLDKTYTEPIECKLREEDKGYAEMYEEKAAWEIYYDGTYIAIGFVKTDGTTPAPEPKPDEPPVPQPTSNPFTDVKEGDYFYEPVLWAVEKGITNGTTDTTFSPEKTCTVTEILTFLWRAAGSPEPTIENPYKTVSMGNWFGPAVIWAYEKGMSVSEELFTADCTRALTATFLWQAAGSPEVDLTSQFTDVDMSSFYALTVAWAVENGVTTGTSGTTFSPSDTCTRGQIATFLYRAFAEK